MHSARFRSASFRHPRQINYRNAQAWIKELFFEASGQTSQPLGAWLIVIFLIGVTPMHKFWGVSDPMMQQMQMVMFMKNLTMLGGALLTSQFGSGPASLDARKK